MNKSHIKIFVAIMTMFVSRYASDTLYSRWCSNSFLNSIISSGSPTCMSLRYVSDTMTRLLPNRVISYLALE